MIKENVFLGAILHFKVGGYARYFAEVESEHQLKDVFDFCRKKNLSKVIIGNGSNCLFNDAGFDGVVIKNNINFCEFNESKCLCGSGFSFVRLGLMSVSKGLSGLEFAAGVPGSVGGAIYMNAGASGQKVSNCLSSVTYVTEMGDKIIFNKDELEFGYRSSNFIKMRGAIATATFEFVKCANAKERQLEMLAKRKNSQPLDELSLGCTFKNPPGAFAGELIEQVGLKGFSVGGAIVSERHANFIVNRGEATAKDVLELKEIIKERVRDKTGIELQEEIEIV